MKQFISVLLIVLFLLVCSSSSSSQYLDELDTMLGDYPKYIAQKEQGIQEQKDELSKAATKEVQYKHCMDIYRSYQDFSLDSAMVYVQKALSLADYLGDRERIVDTRFSLAFLYNYAGMHYEALDIYQAEDVTGCSAWLRRSHFYLGMNVYKNLSVYAMDSKLRDYYHQMMTVCRDSALAYAPEDKILMAERLADQRREREAISILSEGLADGQHTREAGLKYFIISDIYAKLGDRERQEKYLAMSSIVGVHNAVREYVALRQLAVLLYQKGDMERAYTYIHRCIDDAQACNARMRMVETSSVLSVIDSAVVHQKQKTRNLMTATAIVIFILLGTIVLILRKKMTVQRASQREQILANNKLIDLNLKMKQANNQLAEANSQLEDANTQLRQLNEEISEANKVKQEYITRFMHLCLAYISKMENYRNHLNKVAGRRNFDELYETIKSSRYINKEVNEFYDSFDEAFLKIYPSFLDSFNSLLRPEERITLKKNERLNTELRMYALLKLGISDSTKVQEFLRCSSSTVYNYRTNMRNKAINRDTFEQDVQKIR